MGKKGYFHEKNIFNTSWENGRWFLFYTAFADANEWKSICRKSVPSMCEEWQILNGTETTKTGSRK